MKASDEKVKLINFKKIFTTKRKDEALKIKKAKYEA